MAVDDIQAIQKEVDGNYEFFKTLSFEAHQKGQSALLKGRELIAVLETRQDALTMGESKYPDGVYSIQEISADIVDLGFHSYAVHSS